MKRLKEMVITHYEIKKSKFIGYLFPIENEAQAKALIDSIKQEHPKATHHCVAYQIKSEKIARFDDDNEPQHTAGKPMLSVLLAQDLDNVLSVVVRYYGGVKLGKGGLIKAYTQGVTQAIAEATFILLEPVYDVMFDCPFEYAPQIEAYAHHIQSEVSSTYTPSEVHFEIVVDTLDGLLETLQALSKGTVTNIKTNQRFI